MKCFGPFIANRRALDLRTLTTTANAHGKPFTSFKQQGNIAACFVSGRYFWGLSGRWIWGYKTSVGGINAETITAIQECLRNGHRLEEKLDREKSQKQE